MAVNTLDKALQTHIDNIDKASTGKVLKKAISNAFQNIQSFDIPAKTLEGKYPADLVMKKTLTKIFKDGLVFDAAPVKKSTKAVRSGAIADLFGDLKGTYDDYDKLFKIKEE